MTIPITRRTAWAIRPRVRMAGAGLMVLLAGAAFASCDVHKLTGAGSIASLTVTPDATLAINATQQFVAVARDAEGVELSIVPTWSVVQGGGAIDSDGLFTAGTTPGLYTATIQAVSGELSGTATVTVTVGPVAEITVTPNPAFTQINGSQQFTAVAHDAGGNVVSITPAWSVTSGGGTIDASSGAFTAGGTAGTFTNTIRAASGGIAGTATVTVTGATSPPPAGLATITVTPNPASVQVDGTRQFTAVGRDASGDVVPITPVWSVVNGGGTIDGSSGAFTAGGTAGTFSNTVRAASGGISGTATVRVTANPPPALATITVTPDPASMQVNGTQQFTAVGRDANGNVVGMTPAWSVVNGGGTINGNSGMFTAGGTDGTFTNTIRAASDGIEGFATVEIEASTAGPFLDLGTAETYGILAGSEVTCITGGTVNADIGIHPGSALTGFGPCTFSGVTNLGNAIAAEAQADLTTAYNTLAGLPCDETIVADLGGTTLLPGVYCHGSGIGVTGTVTLDGNGDSNAVFVFQAGSTLTTAGNVALINGARAENVYWQVGSSATLGTGSQWRGNILALTSITLNDSATMLGRALARNGAVTLGTNNTINLP